MAKVVLGALVACRLSISSNVVSSGLTLLGYLIGASVIA
jgi:hypothetical protein